MDEVETERQKGGNENQYTKYTLQDFFDLNDICVFSLNFW